MNKNPLMTTIPVSFLYFSFLYFSVVSFVFDIYYLFYNYISPHAFFSMKIEWLIFSLDTLTIYFITKKNFIVSVASTVIFILTPFVMVNFHFREISSTEKLMLVTMLTFYLCGCCSIHAMHTNNACWTSEITIIKFLVFIIVALILVMAATTVWF